MGLAAVKPSVPTTWQGTWLGMQPAQVLLPLLGVLLLHHQQHVQGAALDLAALVRQYEDQVLGRQVALGEDEEAPEDPGAVGQPVEVHGWDSGLKLGQVSAVDVDQNDDPVVFHRGPVVWNGKSFDSKNQLVARKEKPIQVDTILTLDANKGKVISSFGKDMFYMPHDINGDWTVVHSLALYEQEDLLCIADREGKQVECVGAGLRAPQFFGQSSTKLSGLGRVFGIAARGTALIAVNGKGNFYDPPVQGVTLDLAAPEEQQLVGQWGRELQNPHDVAISRSGDAVYVAEIGPNRLRKFEVVTPAAEMF